MKTGILLLTFVLLSSYMNLDAQIKDGTYIGVLPIDIDMTFAIKIGHDSITAYEYSTKGIDSTLGTFSLISNDLNIKWNNQPKNPDQIKVYNNFKAINSDSISIIVRDKNYNPLPGTSIMKESGETGFTDITGKLLISKTIPFKKFSISNVGYKCLQVECDTININNIDSIVFKLEDWNKRYKKRNDEKIFIRDINSNGFELFNWNYFNHNEFVQYLKSDFYNKLLKSNIILRRARFTNNEYNEILKY